MHQKGYNEDIHIMKVWLLFWRKHWLRLVCLSCSLGLVSVIWRAVDADVLQYLSVGLVKEAYIYKPIYLSDSTQKQLVLS